MVLIGCGDMGLRHLRAYAALDRLGAAIEVVGVCDANEELARQRAQWYSEATGRELTVYPSTDATLLDARVDAIDLVLPTRAHHELACTAMRYGKHVFVEKPLALTVRAGTRMVDCATETGRVLAVGQNYRYFPANRALAYALHSGAIGAPEFAVTRYTLDSGGVASLSITERVPKLWHHDVLTMGSRAVLGTGVHEMDLLRYWFGEVRQVYGAVRTLEPTVRTPAGGHVETTADDTCLATLQFESGFVANVLISMASTGPKVGDRLIQGSDGRIISSAWASWDRGVIVSKDAGLTEADQYIADFFASSPTDDPAYRLPEGTYDPAHLASDPSDPLRYGLCSELQDFGLSVTTGTRPQVDGREALRSSVVSFAVLESAALGEAVPVADVADGTIRSWQNPIDESLGLVGESPVAVP
jgi:predicted dehydrogenase